MEHMDFSVTSHEPEDVLAEDILPGILANEISMDTEPEAMKAQAVIVRTNCLRAIAQGEELPEGLTKGEMIRMWGQENFSEYFEKLESCLRETKGVAMAYEGNYIQADFHRCSAGYTRDAEEMYHNEDFPYLKSVDARHDIPSEEFLKVVFYTPQEFLQRGKELFGEEGEDAKEEVTAAEVLERITDMKIERAGYVTEFLIDGEEHSGEEMRLLYGWNSSAFSLKEVDGNIRVVTKGLGHGLGVSLHGANCLAAEGLSYEEILEYFYTGIEFVTE